MGQNLNKPLGLRVSDETRAAIQRLAKQRGTTQTQVVEDAIAAMVEGKDITLADTLSAIRRNWKGK